MKEQIDFTDLWLAVDLYAYTLEAMWQVFMETANEPPPDFRTD